MKITYLIYLPLFLIAGALFGWSCAQGIVPAFVLGALACIFIPLADIYFSRGHL